MRRHAGQEFMHTRLRLVPSFLLGLFLAGLAPAGMLEANKVPSQVTEAYVYKVKYRGFLTAGSEVAIADAVLRTLRLSADDHRESEVWITSKDYDILESVYPFRYRLRSWYRGDALTTLAFETFDQKRHKTKHRLYTFQRTARGATRVDLKKNPEAARLERLHAADFPAAEPAAVAGQAQLFDRLSVVQHLRGQTMLPGESRVLMVTAGKNKKTRYLVKAQQFVDLELKDATRVHALKLTFERTRVQESGAEKSLGEPVTAWVGTAEPNIPLRIEFPTKLGDLLIELVERPVDSVSYDTLAVARADDSFY